MSADVELDDAARDKVDRFVRRIMLAELRVRISSPPNQRRRDDPGDPFPCLDCGADTAPVDAPAEYYMVRDDVWIAAGMHSGLDGPDDGEFLCIGCLERRLDRRLGPSDFTDAPANREDGWRRSPRLLSRLRARS